MAAAAANLVAAHACELEHMGLAPAWATLQARCSQLKVVAGHSTHFACSPLTHAFA